jgi:hypothetical protein
MATAQQAADAIGDINIDWDDANELDEVVKHISQVIHALREKVQRLADGVDETALRETYGQAIGEAAGSLGGVAEQLHETIGGGVLRR